MYGLLKAISDFLPGLDDADEDLRGLMVVNIHRKSEHYGWQLGLDGQGHMGRSCW